MTNEFTYDGCDDERARPVVASSSRVLVAFKFFDNESVADALEVRHHEVEVDSDASEHRTVESAAFPECLAGGQRHTY